MRKQIVSDTGDIFEAARGSIAQSKDLSLSVKDDLNQHRRWLKGYLASEKRQRDARARRLRRRHVMHRRRLRSRLVMQTWRRVAFASLRSLHSVSLLFLGAISTLIYFSDLLSAPRGLPQKLTPWRGCCCGCFRPASLGFGPGPTLLLSRSSGQRRSRPPGWP